MTIIIIETKEKSGQERLPLKRNLKRAGTGAEDRRTVQKSF